MKKMFLSVIGLLFIANVFSCDICGCSSGTYFIGPYTFFHKHFIGLRYTYRSFHTRMKDDAGQYSKDFYQTVEIRAGWKIGKKWEVLAFIPYNFNKQTSDDGTNKSSGLGDITLIGNYNLLNKKSTYHGKKIKQELWIGGGLKIPTGKFNADEEELLPSANNQPGTGSVDMILNGAYGIYINKLGLSSNVTYKINQSAKDFKFGNKLSANAFASINFARPKVTYVPNAGFLFEYQSNNKLANKSVESTGGSSFQGAMGIDVLINKVAFGANVQLPIAENISDNQTHTNVRGMVHVTLLF
jgi:hypothetical protein